MENFKSTYGPMIFFMIISFIVVFSITSCGSSRSETKNRMELLQTEGLDRLMVEECGKYKIVPSKGIAVDTALMDHPIRWKFSVYKLNADSTRYVMCK